MNQSGLTFDPVTHTLTSSYVAADEYFSANPRARKFRSKCINDEKLLRRLIDGPTVNRGARVCPEPLITKDEEEAGASRPAVPTTAPVVRKRPSQPLLPRAPK